MWIVVYDRSCKKDAERLRKAGLEGKVRMLIGVLKVDPFAFGFEKLKGTKHTYCSKRINIKHRLVYEVVKERKIVKGCLDVGTL
jgi:Txe/YoeB family toxin of toxin-antitoxin system